MEKDEGNSYIFMFFREKCWNYVVWRWVLPPTPTVYNKLSIFEREVNEPFPPSDEAEDTSGAFSHPVRVSARAMVTFLCKLLPKARRERKGFPVLPFWPQYTYICVLNICTALIHTKKAGIPGARCFYNRRRYIN